MKYLESRGKFVKFSVAQEAGIVFRNLLRLNEWV